MKLEIVRELDSDDRFIYYLNLISKDNPSLLYKTRSIKSLVLYLLDFLTKLTE